MLKHKRFVIIILTIKKVINMKKQISISLVSAFFVLVAVAVPVWGHDGQTHERGEVQAQERREQAVEARLSAEERVQNIRQDVEERRAQVAQEVCERRSERLQAVIPRLATSSTTLQASIDKMYERVQGFYESGQLTVNNYEELNANVLSAQADSAAAVEAVSTFEFELDCEEAGVGQQLDGFREAVGQARDALNSYRSALVDLISSLRAEAAGQSAAGNENQSEVNDREETDVQE